MTREEIGAAIVAEMKAQKITMPQMCDAATVSRMTLHSIRQGEANPAINNVMAVLEVLGLKIEILKK